MKKNIFFRFLILRNISIILFLFLIAGCNDEPSVVGLVNLNEYDLVNLKSFSSDSVSQSSFTKKIVSNNGSYSQILIGKYYSTEASSLVRFNIFFKDSILMNSVKNNQIKINTAKLRLYPIYKLEDASNNIFRFNAYEILTGWNSDTFTSDSLVSSHFDYNKNFVDESFSYYSDSLVELDINKTKLLKWLEYFADTSKEAFRGLYLKATSATNKIVGFRALPTYSDLPVTNLFIICEYNSKIDTLVYSVSADVHVLESSLNFDKKLFYIQPGVEYRSNLIFNTSSLSKDYVIISAKVELFLDQENSKIGFNSLDSINVFRMLDTSKFSYDSLKYLSIYKEADGKYSGEITFLFQEILNSKNNQGLHLIAKDTRGRAELLAFYGSDYPDPLKRPKLKIIYAKRAQ